MDAAPFASRVDTSTLVPPRKPGMLQAVAIVTLISGIYNLVWAATLLATCYLAIISPYFLVVGILEIVYASKLLGDPVRVNRPATHIAVLEIIAILGCNVIALGAGIFSLVANNDDSVRQYFAQLNAPPQSVPAHPPPGGPMPY